MELYFRNFISEEASLEKLVDDLQMVVQGVDDFARAVGTNLSPEAREEVTTRLNRLKLTCERLKEQALVGARVTDKLVRQNPYWSLAAVFAAGVFVGAKFFRK
jgi:ElaB/YqjD/DUF883 family membrane-anchored ribosome-binding protein